MADRVSAQVKLGSRSFVSASMQVHAHTHTHSVTVQNPYLGYLVTGVGFLMYISEVLFPRTKALLSAKVG